MRAAGGRRRRRPVVTAHPAAGRTSRRRCFVATALLAIGLPAAARPSRLDLRHAVLDLPGPPSKVIPVDMDGDGRRELAVVLAFTEIEQIGGFRTEDLVQIATVIPALFERRELRIYRAGPDRGYELAGPPLPLPPSVHHLEAGPPGAALLALTDDGAARVQAHAAAGGLRLALEPVLVERTALAGTEAFFPSLELVRDLDGDGRPDLMVPTRQEMVIFLSGPQGLGAAAADRVPMPADERREADGLVWRGAIPEVTDLDGDRLPDLVFRREGWGAPPGSWHVHLGVGGGRFRPLRAAPLDCHDRGTELRFAFDDPQRRPWPRHLVALRDLDGDGRAEAVMVEERSRGDSFRKELKDAKRPRSVYRFHRLGEDLRIDPVPYHEVEVEGHGVDVDDLEGMELPFRIQQFGDLDGDGREDLVTITLDFSLFQVFRILTTQTIGIGIDFHVYAQGPDGFAPVPGLDLSERLRLDLGNLQFGRLAHFAGDFDGDGRQDFVHLGRGRQVTIHTGQRGCRFPKKPDLSIRLEEEPGSLDLVRVEDLDGDGRADLRVTRPVPFDDPDLTAPVRLDLYLSGAGP